MSEAAVPIRIAIIDDHELVAVALKSLITGIDPQILIGFVGGDIAELLTTDLDFDVVILDVDLGPNQPPAAWTVAELSARGVPSLLVTALTTGHLVRSALTAGAMGYLSKTASVEELAGAVRSVAAGELVVTAEYAAVLAEASLNLSEREQQAVGLYAQGLPLKTVARRMALSEHTVREYLKRARRKLQDSGTVIDSKVDWVAAARSHGLTGDS